MNFDDINKAFEDAKKHEFDISMQSNNVFLKLRQKYECSCDKDEKKDLYAQYEQQVCRTWQNIFNEKIRQKVRWNETRLETSFSDEHLCALYRMHKEVYGFDDVDVPVTKFFDFIEDVCEKLLSKMHFPPDVQSVYMGRRVVGFVWSSVCGERKYEICGKKIVRRNDP